MGKRSSRTPAHIPSELPRCKACGDLSIQCIPYCKVCNDELTHGIIPPLKPGKLLGSGNSEPWKHDSAYHGDQSNGEW